jgi:hypothetical protein
VNVKEEAAYHATRAVELLRALEAAERQLDDLPDEKRLELAAAGAFPRLNANLEWTAKLAASHALAALALSSTRRRLFII